MHKIINDPVHGFITISNPLVLKIIEHPYFQRLNRIKQLAMAYNVYPGAVHTRFHHALGAYHLMSLSLQELKTKGTVISAEEEVAAQIAILLHDIGHGPFSHALEYLLIKGVNHETISTMLINELNNEFNGQLDLSIKMYTNNYHRPFFYQLISGQLDVDRLDYLTRDSYFTGVSEGNVGHDRILKMLVVQDDELLIEEKAIYSIEKFLVARRLMYGQAYTHKTVLAAEKMLQNIIKRAREIKAEAHYPLSVFLDENTDERNIRNHLRDFIWLDDNDIVVALKKWAMCNDKILSTLSESLLNRNLYKIIVSNNPIEKSIKEEKQNYVRDTFGNDNELVDWFFVDDSIVSSTYSDINQPIKILFKNGEIKDISSVENGLIHEDLKGKIKKHYICWLVK